MRLIETLQASDIIFSILTLILNSFIVNNSINVVGNDSMENIISHFCYPSLMLDSFPSNNYTNLLGVDRGSIK
jgi:hypothetical protein